MKLKRIVSILFLFTSLISSLSAAQYRAVLEPISRTMLSAEVESTVTAINKRMGESFEKDDVLITLKDTIFVANYTKAKALAVKAKADYEAKEQLYRDKVVTHFEFREAQASLAMAEADLILAREGYEAAFIKAPYNGKVVDIYVREFERVQAGVNVIEILDDNILIAKLLLPEELIQQIQVGTEIELVIEETGSKHQAKIVRVGAVIDPVSSLFKVEAEIDNLSHQLRAGMEGMFVIPEASL